MQRKHDEDMERQRKEIAKHAEEVARHKAELAKRNEVRGKTNEAPTPLAEAKYQSMADAPDIFLPWRGIIGKGFPHVVLALKRRSSS